MILPFGEIQNVREGMRLLGESQEFFCREVKYERWMIPLDTLGWN
jgi:hypothetical protein